MSAFKKCGLIIGWGLFALGLICLPMPGYLTNPKANQSIFNGWAYAGSFIHIGLILIVAGLVAVALTHAISETAENFGRRKNRSRKIPPSN
jgi:hypothetical protein